MRDHRNARVALTLAVLGASLGPIWAADPDLTASTATTRPAAIPRAWQTDLTSAQGLTYRVWVAEPSATPAPAPAGGYATLYVLDANAMFATAAEAVRFQKGLVPTLVVGVGYPEDASVDVQRRYHDFTPPTPEAHIWTSGTEPRARPESTGGQDEFLAFLDDVVRPAVAARYPLDPTRRALFGHSLAGRLVLHAMFTRPGSFSHYVAASPSVWWDDRSILGEAGAFAAARRDAPQSSASPPASLLVTAAELEQKPAPGTSEERKRFFAMARMVDGAREVAERLSGLADRGVAAQFVEFAGENHGSVVPAAISRALRFALSPLQSTTRPLP